MRVTRCPILPLVLLLSSACAGILRDAETVAQTGTTTITEALPEMAYITASPQKRQAGPSEGAAGPDELVYEPSVRDERLRRNGQTTQLTFDAGRI